MAFVRIVASCFIAMGSGAALDWPRSTWRVRNIKYTQTNTPDPLPCWLPNPVPSRALRRWHLPCNGFFWELVPVVWSSSCCTRAPAPASIRTCLSSFELEALSVFEFPSATNSSPLPRSFAKRENASTESSIIILCAAWIYKRSNYERIVGKTDLLWKTVKLIDLAWIPGIADIPPLSLPLSEVDKYCKLITFKCSSHTQPHTHAQWIILRFLNNCAISKKHQQERTQREVNRQFEWI